MIMEGRGLERLRVPCHIQSAIPMIAYFDHPFALTDGPSILVHTKIDMQVLLHLSVCLEIKDQWVLAIVDHVRQAV